MLHLGGGVRKGAKRGVMREGGGCKERVVLSSVSIPSSERRDSKQRKNKSKENKNIENKSKDAKNKSKNKSK